MATKSHLGRFCCFDEEQSHELQMLDMCEVSRRSAYAILTFGVPQSHCSSLSTKPLPQTDGVTTLVKSGLSSRQLGWRLIRYFS